MKKLLLLIFLVISLPVTVPTLLFFLYPSSSGA